MKNYILSETKEIYSVHLSEVFQSIGPKKSPRFFINLPLINCKYLHTVRSRHHFNSKNILLSKVIFSQTGIGRGSKDVHNFI